MADKWGGVILGQGKASLSAVAAELADEKTLTEALLYAAAEPVLERMKENLEQHRRSSPSAVDSLAIVTAPARPGAVRVTVGAVGDFALTSGDPLRRPIGDADQGWILRFLEEGTAPHEIKTPHGIRMHPGQPAIPWARPALDAEEPNIGVRLIAFLKARAADIFGKGK